MDLMIGTLLSSHLFGHLTRRQQFFSSANRQLGKVFFPNLYNKKCLVRSPVWREMIGESVQCCLESVLIPAGRHANLSLFSYRPCNTWQGTRLWDPPLKIIPFDHRPAFQKWTTIILLSNFL